MAEEKRKDKVSVMNWGRLGREDRGGGGQGRASQGGRREERGAAIRDRNVPWKETAPPRGGDLLQCKHFKVCPGCEFDRRFDETPIMVDSRCLRGGFLVLPLAVKLAPLTAPNC